MGGMWHLQCSRLRTPLGTHDPRPSDSPPSLQRSYYSRVSDVYRIAQRSNENSKEPNALKHGFIAWSPILDEFWSWSCIFLRSYEFWSWSGARPHQRGQTARVFRGSSLATKARMACAVSRRTQRWTTWGPRVRKGQDGTSPRHGVFAAISMAGMTLPVSWMPVVQGV